MYLKPVQHCTAIYGWLPQVEIEKGTPAFEQVDDAKTYAEEVWQFMEWTPLVDFSAVEDATVNDAYETFVTSAAQLIERKLDADRTLKTTLSTIWVLAR